ncbi:PREDICTED: CLAVATA3/ESR (CLE)-related protein 46 [Lupinus angustifolius]|uniref:CLAVATA3/ESR (CLE)-related protein 46 n=1 Tax=Lupinus angustifolius TaxID=3871 RepID=UPI00092FC05E|nr:PREDICTED: CLAVATA3/ESR (CLE)-related protein 46 [Lupinus angustifolius]
MPKMRGQIMGYVLFACLLLAASALNHVTANVQATQSDYFKLRTLQSIPKPPAGHGNDIEEKVTHKKPSGPNPIGNRFPPSKP